MANPTREQIVNTLSTVYSDYQWNFFCPDQSTILYSNLTWLSDPATKPTAEDLGF